MKAAIFLVVIIGMVAACSPKIINQSSTSIRDSIAIKYVTIYDTVEVQGDTVSFSFDWLNTKDTMVMPGTSHTMDTIRIKNGRAELTLTNNNGKLIAKCKCDSAAIIKKHLDKDTLHFMKTVTDKTGIRLVPVTSGFDHFCEWWFFITAGAVLSISVFKIAKLVYIR